MQGLEEGALARRAVAEENRRDLAVAAFLVGQGHARRDGHVRREDGVGAPEFAPHVAQVHRTAPPLAATRLAAEDFGHERRQFETLGDGVAVSAIGGEDRIARFEGRGATHRDGLLADAGVGAAGEKALAVAGYDMLLEEPDGAHGAIPAGQLVLGRGVFHGMGAQAMTSRMAASTRFLSGKT